MAKVRYGHFKPEESDGCTIVSSIYKFFTKRQTPFRHICVEHDRAYYYGGTYEQRLAADKALLEGVKSYGFPILAYVMYFFVRVFAHPRMPFYWRWCYRVTIVESVTQGYHAGENSEFVDEEPV